MRRLARGYTSLARSSLPPIRNEPMLSYAPGSAERANLTTALAQVKSEVLEVPCVVGGKEVRIGSAQQQVMPSDHKHVIATYHEADEKVTEAAIQAALKAKDQWEATPFESRCAIFLKAADLLSTKYRAEALATNMLGQGKTVWQGEIDAVAEQADFWRFNCKFAEEIYAQQPPESSSHIWNRVQYRPLEGFVFAVSPFNFSAIGSNLPCAPALMGNTVVWKPSSTSVRSNYLTMKILEEAGLPPGVINFVPGHGPPIGNTALKHPDFAGLHFTGSTNTFNNFWRQIGNNLDGYRSYPRIVGETGGKNFHLIHPSADPVQAALQTLRSAFEYQGQKCSACSRAYIPSNLWPKIKEVLLAEIPKIKVGQPDDYESFMSAVIDAKSYAKITNYIKLAKDAGGKVLVGGTADDSKGYFVSPTVIQTDDPLSITMREEIFGPVLTVFVYDETKLEGVLDLVDKSTPYGLTGAIFARDRYVIDYLTNRLRNAAGNFYINDKSTGAVVGQQPFGGSRASGTNDKAGAAANLMRWVSMRSIKESFVPLTTWKYPHQAPGA